MNFVRITLGDIAHTRSGDKGANSNIGVIAYNPEGYRILERYLTAEKVNEFFNPLSLRRVKRYLLPNLGAVNFVLEGALGLGGTCSLRYDAQGKALGQAILKLSLLVPCDQLPNCLRLK